MNMSEARIIGMRKLGIDKRLFDKCKAAANEMEVAAEHMGPMCLAIGIMGYAKATQEREKIAAELTDALALVAKAEREWRMEMKVTH